MDPLWALRDYAMRRELDKIVPVNDQFRFGSDYVFPRSAKTAYRCKQGNLYTLETLAYFLLNANAKYTDYLQNALSHGVSTITFIGRKPLLDYLSGKLASTDYISEEYVQNKNVQDKAAFDFAFLSIFFLVYVVLVLL